ncbi:MAG: hypothetical protein ACREPS_00070 [Rhodanobacteraceae bacterium]
MSLPLQRVPIDGKNKMPTSTQRLDRITTLKFRRRKESWVAEADGCFYKITRRSNDPLQDLGDPACIATSLSEYTDVRYLRELSDRVCCPERIEQACIVYPLLTGPDMYVLLMSNPAHERRESCLRDALQLLARLHHDSGAGHPMKDYRRDSFLPPNREVLDCMERRKRTLVITGFEARNIRFDSNRAAWFFFDPHHLWRGFPEEDFARFLVSLLMIRGRRGGPRPWTSFDRFGLLSTYENFAPAKLDRNLLNYFLHEQLAMRRSHAMKSARQLPTPSRVFGVAYTQFYYRQLRRTLPSQKF